MESEVKPLFQADERSPRKSRSVYGYGPSPSSSSLLSSTESEQNHFLNHGLSNRYRPHRHSYSLSTDYGHEMPPVGKPLPNPRLTQRPRSVPPTPQRYWRGAEPPLLAVDDANIPDPHWIQVFAPQGYRGQMALVPLAQARQSFEGPRNTEFDRFAPYETQQEQPIPVDPRTSMRANTNTNAGTALRTPAIRTTETDRSAHKKLGAFQRFRNRLRRLFVKKRAAPTESAFTLQPAYTRDEFNVQNPPGRRVPYNPRHDSRSYEPRKPHSMRTARSTGIYGGPSYVASRPAPSSYAHNTSSIPLIVPQSAESISPARPRSGLFAFAEEEGRGDHSSPASSPESVDRIVY